MALIFRLMQRIMLMNADIGHPHVVTVPDALETPVTQFFHEMCFAG